MRVAFCYCASAGLHWDTTPSQEARLYAVLMSMRAIRPANTGVVSDLAEEEPTERPRAYQRQRAAWNLYVSGASEQQIKDRLGYKTLAVVRAALSREAKRHMAYRDDEIRALRDLELRRLDALQMTLWDHATGANDDEGRPSLPAIDRVLKIMQHRAALLGLDSQPAASDGASTVTNNVLVVGADASYVDDLRRAAASLGIADGKTDADVIDVQSA